MVKTRSKICQFAIIGCLLLGWNVSALSTPISFDFQIAHSDTSIFRLNNTSNDAAVQVAGFTVTIWNKDYSFDIGTALAPIDNSDLLTATLLDGNTNRGKNNTNDFFDQILFNNESVRNTVIEGPFLTGLETGTLALTLPDVNPTQVLNYSASDETNPVPVPTTMLFLGTSLAWLAEVARRKKKQNSSKGALKDKAIRSNSRRSKNFATAI